jgi:NADH dehydrogenase [ubiquinone] 1 alpha subcomplex assembly factor 7
MAVTTQKSTFTEFESPLFLLQKSTFTLFKSRLCYSQAQHEKCDFSMKRHICEHIRISYRLAQSCYQRHKRLPWKINLYRELSDKGRKSKKVTEFSIDTSAFTNLRSMTDDDVYKSSLDVSADKKVASEHKEKLTELGADLISYISMKGPLTMNDYMSFCLNHPKYGYYQREDGDKIGEVGKGDFITAPEISQLFGEIIAIWLISTWQHMNQPSIVNIIELGPGNGTLMADVLRVAKKFPTFKAAMRIHMIEMSQTMRDKQRVKLNCKAVNTQDVKNIQYVTSDNIPISWHSFLSEVADNHPSLIIGQEFLDIFPVHQFIYQGGIWREKLVDVDKDSQSPYHFRTVIAPKETPAVKALLGSKAASSHVLIKPQVGSQIIDDKLRAAAVIKKNIDDREVISTIEGDGIEISPLALATCEDIAMRLRKSNGAALLIDYGENFAQMDSIRGFKDHKQVHYLSEPGRVDITVDIDFAACARVAAEKGAKVYGPVTQSDFLLSMGALERIENLIDSPSVSEEDAENIVESFKMIIDPNQMGKRFKVLCIANHKLNIDGFSHDTMSTPATGATQASNSENATS